MPPKPSRSRNHTLVQPPIRLAPDHAIEEYLPEERSRRQGIALCLSGGGFRASLFHLGVLRRLNELGVLSQVDRLSTVSGASIMAAHLVARLTPWPQPGATADGWEDRVAAPFRAFTAQNIRTGPLLCWLATPWRWRRTSIPIEALTRRFEENLTPMRLGELPDRPRFTLCATDMRFGVSWGFGRREIGDYRAGVRRPSPHWSLGRAVAASCCFPPVFDAMEVGVARGEMVVSAAAGRKDVLSVRLTDGGVYDNLGLEPVWKTAKTILVSDGGALFQFAESKSLIDRLRRYPSIMGNQVGALRKRWLIASFAAGQMQGAYWGIASTAEHYYPGATGYSESLVREIIAPIRTDMDSFSIAESAVLENHGYCLAEAAIRKHRPELPSGHAQAFVVPHPDWMDEGRVRHELRDSHTRRFFGRGWRAAVVSAIKSGY